MDKHLFHGGGTRECVGTVVDAREDNFGLWIRAEFSSDAHSQSVRTKVVEKHVGYLSVGYLIKERIVRDPANEAEVTALENAPFAAQDGTIIELLKCDLDEVTVTPFPIQTLAAITNAKARRAGRKSAAFESTKMYREMRLRELGVRPLTKGRREMHPRALRCNGAQTQF